MALNVILFYVNVILFHVNGNSQQTESTVTTIETYKVQFTASSQSTTMLNYGRPME